eukprot:gene5870-4191_t
MFFFLFSVSSSYFILVPLFIVFFKPCIPPPPCLSNYFFSTPFVPIAVRSYWLHVRRSGNEIYEILRHRIAFVTLSPPIPSSVIMSSSTSPATKQMLRPANIVYKFIQDGQRVRVWLVHDSQTKIEGVLLGYDQYMNVVLGDAKEIDLKKNQETNIGKMLLRSDNVGLIHPIGLDPCALAHDESNRKLKINPRQKTKASAAMSSTGEQQEQKPAGSGSGTALHEKTIECMVCSGNAFAFFCFPCGHYTCYICGLRIRQLKQNCPVCRKPSDQGILTSRVSLMEDQYCDEEIRFMRKQALFDKRLSCYIDTRELAEEVTKLYRPLCPLECCWSNGVQEPFATVQLLRQHLKNDHGLQYCHVCLERRPLFLCEQTLYNDTTLRQHNRGVCEFDSAAFTGHPRCLFCHGKQLFLDGEDLIKHMREKHFSCDCCNRGQYNFTFFCNRDKLYAHFHCCHKICDHPNCATKDTMERVFLDDFELDCHRQRVHNARPATFKLGSLDFPSLPTSGELGAAGHRGRRGGASPQTADSADAPVVANSADITVMRIIFDHVDRQETLDLTPKTLDKGRGGRNQRRPREQGPAGAEASQPVACVPGQTGLPKHFINDKAVVHLMLRESIDTGETDGAAGGPWGNNAATAAGSSRVGGRRQRSGRQAPQSAEDIQLEAKEQLTVLLQRAIPRPGQLDEFKNETRHFMNSVIKTSEYFDTLTRLLPPEALEEILPVLVLTCPNEEKQRALKEMWKMRMAPERLRQEKARQEDEAKKNKKRHTTATRNVWGKESAAALTDEDAPVEDYLVAHRRIAEELAMPKAQKVRTATYNSPGLTAASVVRGNQPVLGAKVKATKGGGNTGTNVWAASAQRLHATSGGSGAPSTSPPPHNNNNNNNTETPTVAYHDLTAQNTATATGVSQQQHRDPQPRGQWASVAATAAATTSRTQPSSSLVPPAWHNAAVAPEPQVLHRTAPLPTDSPELFPSLLSEEERRLQERAAAKLAKGRGKKKVQLNAWFSEGGQQAPLKKEKKKRKRKQQRQQENLGTMKVFDHGILHHHIITLLYPVFFLFFFQKNRMKNAASPHLIHKFTEITTITAATTTSKEQDKHIS